MDWADEIAERIFHEFQASDILIEPISAALRKARADGIREAVKILKHHRIPNAHDEAIESLLEKAKKLDPPQSR